MNREQILELADRVYAENKESSGTIPDQFCLAFAGKIIAECTSLLFDESERLYAYSSECDNLSESEEAEVVAEKCMDMIRMLESHFGVE